MVYLYVLDFGVIIAYDHYAYRVTDVHCSQILRDFGPEGYQ